MCCVLTRGGVACLYVGLGKERPPLMSPDMLFLRPSISVGEEGSFVRSVSLICVLFAVQVSWCG
jgi:hypothetical protein